MSCRLIRALIENPDSAFVDFSRQPDASEIAQLRKPIVEQIARAPGPGEKIEQWRGLLDGREPPSKELKGYFSRRR